MMDLSKITVWCYFRYEPAATKNVYRFDIFPNQRHGLTDNKRRISLLTVLSDGNELLKKALSEREARALLRRLTCLRLDFKSDPFDEWHVPYECFRLTIKAKGLNIDMQWTDEVTGNHPKLEKALERLIKVVETIQASDIFGLENIQ
jgi:hypothetical protein